MSKRRKWIMIIIAILLILILIFGKVNKGTGVWNAIFDKKANETVELEETIEIVEKENCKENAEFYIKINNQYIYTYCLESIQIKKENQQIELKEYWKDNPNALEKMIDSNHKDTTIYKDGGTIRFKSQGLTMIKCHKELDDAFYNTDIYIGPETMEYQNGFCEQNHDIDKIYDDLEYTPIGQLPVDYNLEKAVTERALVITYSKIYNAELYDSFVEKIKKKESAFLRIIQSTVEGDAIILDIKYDSKTNKAIVVTDNTRDQFLSDDDRKITIDEYEHIEEHIEMLTTGGIRELIVYNGILENDYRILCSFNGFMD